MMRGPSHVIFCFFQWMDVAAGRRPDAGLPLEIMELSRSSPPPVTLDETVEIIRFLEAANESREHAGRDVGLYGRSLARSTSPSIGTGP